MIVGHDLGNKLFTVHTISLNSYLKITRLANFFAILYNYLPKVENFIMNTKIFKLIKENLNSAFNLPKYEKIRSSINKDTLVDQLPWTPARYKKFRDAMYTLRLSKSLDTLMAL